VTIVGAPTDWTGVIDSLVPVILTLVIATWEEMPLPSSDADEDKITDALCRALRVNRTVRGLPFQIRTQVIESDPVEGEDLGRMDIAFIPLVPREDIYFCLENKRLNVVIDGKFRPYASEYVRLGMLRFVIGTPRRFVTVGW
jgi:hypothetical protein